VRRILGSRGLATNVLALAALVYTAYVFSVPSPFMGSIYSELLWIGVGLAWLVHVAVTVWRNRPLTFGATRSWLIVPTLAAIALTLVWTEAPFQARYRLSRGAMDSTARRVMRDPGSADRIDRIGLWNVSAVERVPGGMRFLVDGSGFIDFGGFAYSPNGPPQGADIADYEHLDGPWWLWWFDF
jgi:hypothetical protein